MASSSYFYCNRFVYRYRTVRADEQAVLVFATANLAGGGVDGSAFAKKGSESCGVKRQWCGRLGKIENCQVGVFLCYAGTKGHAPLDRRLYLAAASRVATFTHWILRTSVS